MHLNLRTKILSGILFISSLSIGISLYAFNHFQQSEAKLRNVNESYIPILQLLGQLDNQLLFFDYDLERAMRDPQWRPNWLHIKLMEAKIKSIHKEIMPGSFLKLEERVDDLEAEFSGLKSNVELIFQKTETPVEFSEVSMKRNNFKHKLQSLIKNIEDEIHNTSMLLQKNTKNSIIIIETLLVFSFVSMLILFYKIGEALQPLQEVTKRMKKISELGLSDIDSVHLPIFRGVNDEIALFSREFNRMASSLADRNLQLIREQFKLKKAHEEMGEQNKILRNTQKKLLHQEKLALVGKLSAQIAHEIRNPLNALGLHLEVLEQSVQRPENKDSVNAIKKEIERLSVIAESYLDLARAPKLDFSLTDINQLIIDSIKLYEPAMLEKAIVCSHYLGEMPPIEVDAKQVSLVLGNLLNNSKEALEECDDVTRKEIKLTTRSNGNFFELVCEDNGPGISSEIADAIFSPFFTTKSQGTGLGLAHSKQVIEAHGGEILFESKEGKGTIFKVKLPMVNGFKYRGENEIHV